MVNLYDLESEKFKTKELLENETAVLSRAEEIRDEMEEVTKTISKRLQELDSTVIIPINDDQICANLKHLCTLHKIALRLSKEYRDSKKELPDVLLRFYNPQICNKLFVNKEGNGCEPIIINPSRGITFISHKNIGSQRA